MFTGIIESVAKVESVQPYAGGRRLTFSAGCADEIGAGDSVALDGICLTAESGERPAGQFVVSAVEETLRRSTATEWRRGTRVHLERALPANGRFDGHIVQGHVDGVGSVLRAGREGSDWVLTLHLDAALRRYVVEKGSLAVNGVSLTVGSLRGGQSRLYIIPETLSRTCIGEYQPGRRVNLEVDLVAKYVESLLGSRGSRR